MIYQATAIIVPDWFLYLMVGAVWINIILDLARIYYQRRLSKQQPKAERNDD